MSGTIAPAPDHEQHGHDPSALTPRLRAILAIVLIADIVDLMDSTITNIAAPTIIREIGGGESLVKWLGASYALAMGVLLVVGGRLGDRFGKRRMFLVGIAGFGLASLLCGLAVDPAMLITARLLQGALGALLIPQGMGLLIANFARERFPRAASAFGPVMGGAAVLGPIVAGFLIGANIGGLTWRPVFLINIILCALGLAAAWRLLPRDADSRPAAIDGLGAGLLVTLLGAAGLLVTALAAGPALNAWLTAPSILVLGAGMGACLSSIYDVAIGDVDGDEAGSASGSLSSVQQLAAAIGSAVVTTVYFAQARHMTAVHALTVSVAVVAAITAACLAMVWLLPAKAPAEDW